MRYLFDILSLKKKYRLEYAFVEVYFILKGAWFFKTGVIIMIVESKSRSIITYTNILLAVIFHIVAVIYFRKYMKEEVKIPYDPYYNTSIAFYVIVGATHHIPPEEDIRGRFWEFQLPYNKLNTTVHYVSDGPIKINGEPALVPGDNPNATFNDRQFCIRAKYVWKHFVENHKDTKWFFRGIHDTFVNMTGLVDMLRELEKKIDPMNEWGLVYNVHEYGYQLYPHGGTGYLFSNYAVRQFVSKIANFDHYCYQIADDVGLAPFMRDLFGLDITKYISNKFIVTWPNTENDIIFKKEYHKASICPPYYQLYTDAFKLTPCPAKTAVSIHMHRVNMRLALPLLQQTPDDFSVTYPTPSNPTFCRVVNNIVP